MWFVSWLLEAAAVEKTWNGLIRASGDTIDGKLCFVTVGYLLQRLVNNPEARIAVLKLRNCCGSTFSTRLHLAAFDVSYHVLPCSQALFDPFCIARLLDSVSIFSRISTGTRMWCWMRWWSAFAIGLVHNIFIWRFIVTVFGYYYFCLGILFWAVYFHLVPGSQDTQLKSARCTSVE